MTRVDIVIPVYKGLAQTRRCLESVLAEREATPFEIVVVDDATPEPQIARYLDALAAGGRITLLRNDANLGFVQSVNRGMALHGERDVALLNSDTEVANDWLDRLRAAAHREPDIGTVTPFSNNATICSYPFDGWVGGLPGALGLRELDRLFAATHATRTLDLPTAVGFCMYIRRECLEAVGPFDAARFGRGYGEENDFCLRAAKTGWRNVLAADVFILHEGAVSFSGERFALMQSALEALLAAHPDYMDRVRDFIARDPANVLRIAVDEARTALGAGEARHVLAERGAERTRLRERVAELEKAVADRDAAARTLNESLARSAALVAGHIDQIERLREGLRHAETLAFDREKELQRIHAYWLWKPVKLLMKLQSKPSR